jgi:uncharacterized oxidoreductase
LLRPLRVSFKNYHATNPSAIRLTSALIEHLKEKSDAVVAYTSSVLGFVTLAGTAVYSSTKATLHSYFLSQRFMLRDTTVRVLEIAPPWVRTELMNSQEAKQAMPLEQFIEETIAVLRTDAEEILVDAAKPLRANVGPNEHGLVNDFNAQMMAIFAGGYRPPAPGAWLIPPPGTRSAMATRASGWTQTLFRCYIEPG